MNGTEQITVTTDDSKAADMSKGDIFSYSATGDTLADIEYSENKQADYYVTAYDDASGDISCTTLARMLSGLQQAARMQIRTLTLLLTARTL